MKIVQSFEEAVSVYNAFLSQRAFAEGYAAALAGVPRTRIPENLSVFSGNWVEGWLTGALDELDQPAGVHFQARLANPSGLPLLAA